MPLDPAVLLQAKPIEVPNPLDLATKGLTLADIMNKVQAGDISLQQQRAMVAAMSDPRFLEALSGSGQPDAGAAMPGGAGSAMPGGGGSGQPSGAALAGLIRDNPQAGPALYKQMFELQKQQADIGKLNADSFKARIDARTEQLKSLGNFASRAADNPTPDNYVGVVSQLSHIGMPLDSFGPIPALNDVDGQKVYFAGLSAAVTAPEQAGRYAIHAIHQRPRRV